MKNAFDVLGATPFDDAERLEELLEEKELISDDDTEAQAAYTELSNPKRRVISELSYFAGETFSAFESIALGTRPEKPTVGEPAQAIVNMGKWLDSANEAVLDEINDARSSSNFPLIDESLLRQSVDTFSSECSALAQKYFDRLKENSLVSIFNNIVGIKDYGSFFIDELMAKYETTIKDTLSEKEKKCTETFNEVEQICNRFNHGYTLDSNLGDKITSFSTALKTWDRYAQPLQVNAQHHGGQHEESSDLVRSLRNKIIDLCNHSQETLGKMIEQVGMYNFQARESLPEKLSDSVEFTTQLIKLIDILSSVFAELEITAEQLKKDKQSLRELLATLSDMNAKIQGAVTERKHREARQHEEAEKTRSRARIAQGVLAGICFIVMIIGFAVGNIGLGIGFLVLALGFGICCAAYDALTEKNAKKWVVIVAAVIAIIIFSTVDGPDGPAYEGELNGNNFERAFNVSGSASEYGFVSYYISPKDDGYAECSSSSSTISVTIRYEFSGGTSGGRSGKKNITLNKSSGYRANGTFEVYGYFTYTTCSVEVISASGYVYLD